MGFFDKAKETFRDKTRDKFYAGLQTLGLDVEMAERGRPEEHVGEDFGSSLGLIEIRGSPIRWVNVLKDSGGPDRGSNYTLAFLVPNPNIQRKAHLKTIREKSTPVVGRVVDLQWQGNFEDSTDIFTATMDAALRNQSLTRLREDVRRLNEDVSLNENLIRLNADVHIYGYPKYDYWAILHISGSLERDCLETIARHLLEPVEPIESKEI